MAYWLQVQTMSEREKRRFDASLVAEPNLTDPASALSPGASLLAGMMAKGGM